MHNTRNLTVSKHDAGLRLDKWIAIKLAGVSRSRIQRLIRGGNATVDGRIPKEHHRTRSGERVRIVFPPARSVKIEAESAPLDIVYQDADIVVVNKPPGMITHPAADGAAGTLVNALLYHCPDISALGSETRPGIAHRLDKDTSGIMVAARNRVSLEFLLKQFKTRRVQKEYLAIIHGRIDPEAGAIRTTVARDPANRTRMSATVAKGRIAKTLYKTLEKSRGLSLVLLKPETGRTHQLRVHLAHLGCPVVGDRKYGGQREMGFSKPVHRHMLHAWKLAFTHPGTLRKVGFAAPPPPDMVELMSVSQMQIPGST